MAKIPKLNDKELMKWIGILGVDRIKKLYMDSKIHLTSVQLDTIIAMKSEDKLGENERSK